MVLEDYIVYVSSLLPNSIPLLFIEYSCWYCIFKAKHISMSGFVTLIIICNHMKRVKGDDFGSVYVQYVKL